MGKNRTSWLSFGVLIVVVVALVGHFVLQKQSHIDKKASGLAKQVQVLRAEIADAQPDITRHKQIEASIAQFQKSLPATTDVSEVISDLSSLATSDGVTLTSIAPGQTTKSGQVSGLQTAVAVSGPEPAVQRYVASVEGQTRLMSVTQVSYSWAASKVTAQMTVEVWSW